MSNLNLDTLLESLEKAASEKTELTKEAADKPQVSKELEAVLTKEAAATNVKRAFEDGEKMAKHILEKLANDAITAVEGTEPTTTVTTETETEKKEVAVEKTATEVATEVAEEVTTEATKVETVTTLEENMNKEAKEAGKDLASAILEKLAASQIQTETAEMVAQHDKRIMPTPGTNGRIAAVMDALVARAKGTGIVTYDQVAGDTKQDPKDGVDPALGTPAIAPSPDVINKQAAVTALIEAGIEWEDAVELVKAAAYEIEQEEIGQVKLAAVSELMAEGIDFDSAVAAVVEATTPKAE